MFESLTPEFIKADMLSEFSMAETREGSYTNTLVSPAAYEMWKVYQSLDALPSMLFVNEGSGRYIDINAALYGLYRKPGTAAKAAITFAGADGAVIKAGKVFLTADSLQYTLDADVAISGGAGAGLLTAKEAGAKYNAPAGAICRQLVNQAGVEAVASGAATGGSDQEGDAAFAQRYNAYRRRPPTSGNAAHYEAWAMETPGVGAAKIVPLWDGPGTVKVLVVGEGGQPVGAAVVQGCAGHIEEARPIGAAVTVVGAAGLAIDVAATAILRPSADAAAVRARFSEAIAGYLESIAFKEYLVAYNRIGYLLLGVPGVVDFTALAVNGGAADIPVGDDEVPVAGSVVVMA